MLNVIIDVLVALLRFHALLKSRVIWIGRCAGESGRGEEQFAAERGRWAIAEVAVSLR
jgi:hypothetical protein